MIPNLKTDNIQSLQKLLSNFIWDGKYCRRVVVGKETATKPQHLGGMNVPHVEHFWSALRATWAHRLLQATDGQIWAELALQRMGRALGRKKLNTRTLLETGLHTIKGKCKKIPFWSDV